MEEISEISQFSVVLVEKNPPANAGDVRNMGLIPGSGRSPGEENGNPLQYSCLENVSLKDNNVWAEATDVTLVILGGFLALTLGSPAYDLRMDRKMIFVLLLSGRWNFFFF